MFLLFVGGALVFPANPAVGFLMAALALTVSSELPAGLGQALELVMFYGALAGVLSAFL